MSPATAEVTSQTTAPSLLPTTMELQTGDDDDSEAGATSIWLPAVKLPSLTPLPFPTFTGSDSLGSGLGDTSSSSSTSSSSTSNAFSPTPNALSGGGSSSGGGSGAGGSLEHYTCVNWPFANTNRCPMRTMLSSVPSQHSVYVY